MLTLHAMRYHALLIVQRKIHEHLRNLLRKHTIHLGEMHGTRYLDSHIRRVPVITNARLCVRNGHVQQRVQGQHHLQAPLCNSDQACIYQKTPASAEKYVGPPSKPSKIFKALLNCNIPQDQGSNQPCKEHAHIPTQGADSKGTNTAISCGHSSPIVAKLESLLQIQQQTQQPSNKDASCVPVYSVAVPHDRTTLSHPQGEVVMSRFNERHGQDSHTGKYTENACPPCLFLGTINPSCTTGTKVKSSHATQSDILSSRSVYNPPWNIVINIYHNLSVKPCKHS